MELKKLIRKQIAGIPADFSIKGCWSTYFVLIALLTWFKVVSCVRFSGNMSYCLSDIICYVEHYQKYETIPMIGILLMILLRNEYRVSVMMTCKSHIRFLTRIIQKIIMIALTAGIYQTICLVLIGLRYSVYQCNWQSMEAVPFHKIGRVITQYPSVQLLILLYFLFTVGNSLLAAAFIMLGWFLMESPVVGYAVVIILLIYEFYSASGTATAFTYMDLRPEKIYLLGLQSIQYIPPILMTVTLFFTGYEVLKHKDFLRLK